MRNELLNKEQLNDIESINRFNCLPWVEKHKSINSHIDEFVLKMATDPRLDRNGASGLKQALDILDIIENNTGNNSSYPGEISFTMPESMTPAILLNEALCEKKDKLNNIPIQSTDNIYGVDNLHTDNVNEYMRLSYQMDGEAIKLESIATLSYINSAKGFGKLATEWRDSYTNKDIQAMVTRAFQIDECRIMKKYGLGEEFKNIFKEPKKEVHPSLMKYRQSISNFEKIIDDMSSFDIEGLLMKAGRMIYNLKEENILEDRCAENWCSAQELLSYYGPTLETVGFKKMADLCYSVANEYFYKDDVESIKLAKNMHERAVEEFHRYGFNLATGLGRSENLQLDGYRVKSVGSILSKMDRKTNYIPDAIAFMITSKKRIQAGADLYKVVNEVVDFVKHQTGSEIGNSMPNEASVEIRWNELNISDTEALGMHYTYSLNGETLDGYEGIHLSATTPGGIGMEIQIHDEKTAEKRDGIASHIFYNISKYSGGELAQLRLALDDAKTKIKRKGGLETYQKAKEAFDEKRFDLDKKIKQVALRLGHLSRIDESHSRVNPKALDSLLKDVNISDDVKSSIRTAYLEGEIFKNSHNLMEP